MWQRDNGLNLDSKPHNPDIIRTILTKTAFENIVGKGEMLMTSIFSFSHNVSYPSKTRFHFLGYLYLFCHLQTAFNLDKSKILAFGIDLNFVVEYKDDTLPQISCLLFHYGINKL